MTTSDEASTDGPGEASDLSWREPLDLNSGALAPVADEVDLVDLAVEGELPAALNGVLVRNGPNPRSGRFDGEGVLSWWTGAAMIHGIAFADGKACWYRNRWIDGDGTNPNVNVIEHGGQVLALTEMARPVALGPDLRPLGPASFDPGLPGGMCAHPKIDPATNELIYVMANWEHAGATVGIVGPASHRGHDIELGRHRPDLLGTLWRYRLDLASGQVTETPLDDRHVELPRIDERLTGRRHRFVHAVEQPTDREIRGVISYDLERGTSTRHAVAPGDNNSEFVFAPDPDRTGETGGWLLGSVHRAERDADDIEVLDAADPSAGPVAVIHLSRRIPAGFHGTWLPDPQTPGSPRPLASLSPGAP